MKLDEGLAGLKDGSIKPPTHCELCGRRGDEVRETGDEFCRRHLSGNYILHQAHHVVAVEDGIVYDNFDSSKRCVYEAWEINARSDPEPEGDK